jgi:DNA-directed RNA polymerase I, II, and III subunit RPABC5
MIIPVKCFSCGKVLGDMYRYYVTEVRKIQTDKTAEGEMLDKLRLNKICCRRHMLTHVDIE